MMRPKVFVLFILLAVPLSQIECRLGGFSTPAFAQEGPVSVAGKWVITMEIETGAQDATLTLEQEGADLVGMLSSEQGDLEIVGVVEENGEVVFWGSFDAGSGMMIDINFFATLAKETDTPEMEGEMEIITPDGEFAVNFRAEKIE